MTAKLELSVTRFIEAPPAVVWRAWKDHTAEWWCPKPWTTPVIEWDLRAGGRAYTVMQSPEGEQHPNDGVFLEVVPERRVVFTDAFKSGWIPEGPFMVGIMTFEPEGAGTRYTGSARHWTQEAYDQHKTMGFEGGWGQVADQLAAVAERLRVAA